ncbi:PKD domain-containing protein [Chitinophaga sp. RCC_12]|uniref:PKD domain-containing protein n=1 Tax=Chitinophaga sp. RCC_12 TaxID=3239226 RepID=UPI00352320EE
MSNIKGFYEYLPAGYTPGSGKKYPLIIFFHGNGELASYGSPLSAVLRNGLPRVINDGKFPTTFTVNNQTFSFIVISPQFNTWPGSGDVTLFKNYLLTKYDIDPSRIYITGLSMGGGLTWGALCEDKTKAKAFAAAAVVCGMYPPTTAYAAVVASNNTPVWAFHNDADPTVPSDYSKNWIKYINATVPAPNPLAKLSIYSAASHDAWTRAYDPATKEDGKNMYEWMLQYTQGGTVPTTPPPVTGGKRIVVPMSNTANGRAEMYYPDAMKTFNVNPGDTLCIPAGEYEYLHLGNLTGTAAKPIVIINCGGQVKLGVKNQGTAAVFNAPTCRFVEISGSGDKNYEFGFDLNGTNITGLKIFGLTLGMGASDFDVHNVYIHDGNILLQAKTLQTCAQPQYLEGSFVMKNVKLHHIKCRNSTGEGFYIGNTHYYWTEGTCVDMKSHWIENLWVYDNDLENIGSDGLQISMAKNGDNRVFNNRLVNYATSKNSAHGYGILIGSGSALKVYNNTITTGYMPGVTVFGSGVSEIYNNVISDIFYEGINVADKIPENTTPDVFPPPAAIIYNNTIVNTDAGKNGIKIFAYQTPIGHQVYNNLLVETGTAYDYPSKGMYIKGDLPIKLTASNNLCYTDVASAKFVDGAAKNYRLTSTSTAVNTGRDMTDFSLKTDFDNTARPQQSKYDVGAFELKTGTTSPPVSNAGGDLTITLPIDYVTLDGASSAASGGSTIQSYVWKKISGPTAGTIVSPNVIKTNVTGLTQGTYVYALTVTDDKGLTDSDSITVTVKPATNKPPVANAGSNIQVQLPVNSASLDGSASTDADGQITTWAWTKTAGPAGGDLSAANAAKTNVANLVAGTYTYRLIITDNTGAKDTATVNVTVTAATNKPPVANAGSNIQVQLPVNSASLDGSASADADGQITTWAWTKTAGPAGGDLSATNAAKTNVANLLAGTYTYRLIITDNTGAKDTATVNVTVTAAANKPPVAYAGKNIQIQLPVNTSALDGSSSTDSDGQIVTWSWQKTAGPAGGDLASAGASKTTVSNLSTGTYTYQLTVTDNNNATATATVTILVLAAAPNLSPVADAGNDIAIQLPVSNAALDGSASTDADGQIVTWLWEKTAGPAGGNLSATNAAKTNVTNLQAGTYTFRLTVTDNDGATSNATVNITVTAAPVNNPPVAVAGNDIQIQLPVSSAALDGSASTDADGQIVTWLWEKTAGPAGGNLSATNAAKTNVTNLQAGTYTFRLTVTDNDGATSNATVNITVSAAPVNKPPVAVAGNDIQIQLPVSSAALDGSASTDADGQIVTWLWEKTAGPAGGNLSATNAAKTNVTNLQTGTYTFRLTVTDNNGATNSSSVSIMVLPLENKVPVAQTQGDRSIQQPMNSFIADGSSSYDPDGNIVKYEWTQVEGPATANLKSPDQVQTLINGLHAGKYEFKLTVTDDRGGTATSTFTLTVLGNDIITHEEDSLGIFPNPATQYIRLRIVRSGATPLQVRIFDMNGRMQQQLRYTTPDSFQTEVNISNLSNGHFIIDVKSEDSSYNKKGRFIKVSN